MKHSSVGKSDAFVINDKSVVCGIAKKITWNGNNWALGCDFRGNDVKNVRSSGEQCGGLCAADTVCTHFTWNNAFGGTCWMKDYDGLSKDDALVASDTSSVCGVI